MAKNSIGIYISSRYVDIIELSGSVRSPNLLNFIRQEIPPMPEEKAEGVEDKTDSYKQCVASALKEGLTKVKSISGGAYTVLKSGEAIIRFFKMPLLPRSEQSQAVRFESRKYIPFKLTDVVSDFKVLSDSKGAKTMDIFFIAGTKEQINIHMDIFKQAGIDIAGIDIIPFALAHTLLLSKKAQPKENVAIIYIDNNRESASIHIMEKGMPFFSRDLKISTDDKEALFEKLSSEARVSIDYYLRQRSQSEISKIIVCGEKIFDGLDAYISDELKIITEMHEDLSAVKGAGRTPPSSIIALGAALAGLGRLRYSVNLSPRAAAIKQKKIVNILIIEAAVALFIIVSSFLLSSIKVRVAMNGLNMIKAEGEALPKDTAGLPAEALDKLRSKRLKQLSFMQLLLNNRLSWAEKMSKLSKDLPKGVWVNRFNMGGETIKDGKIYPSGISHSMAIAGSSFLVDGSKEAGSINSFFTTLKKDKVFMDGFNNIELGSIDKRSVGDYAVTTFKMLTYSGTKPADGRKQAGRPRWQRR